MDIWKIEIISFAEKGRQSGSFFPHTQSAFATPASISIHTIPILIGLGHRGSTAHACPHISTTKHWLCSSGLWVVQPFQGLWLAFSAREDWLLLAHWAKCSLTGVQCNPMDIDELDPGHFIFEEPHTFSELNSFMETKRMEWFDTSYINYFQSVIGIHRMDYSIWGK